MKVEKLLRWVIAFEFAALVIGVSSFFIISHKKPEPIEIVEAIEPEVIEEIKTRTPAEWEDLIQEVAYNEYKTKLSDDVAHEIYYFTRIWGNYYDIPVETVLAQIGQECWFKPNLVNKNSNGSKDYGVMMVNDAGITDYNNANWKNPVTAEQVQNDISIGIKVGCWNYANKRRILNIYEIETTEYNVLCAYNAGQGKVRKGTIPASTETYVSNVQYLKQKFF